MNKEDLSFKIKQSTDVNVRECYQCGKCTAGCPLAEHMDLRPSVIMRMLQSGDKEDEDKILRSLSIWLCQPARLAIRGVQWNWIFPKSWITSSAFAC